MDFNKEIKPYKRRLMAESFIRASIFGAFFGLCVTLVASLIFRLLPDNWYRMQTSYLLIAILSGVGVALVVGTVIYVVRYKRGVNELNIVTAKRVDSQFGLEERALTANELRDVDSVIAKLQREALEEDKDNEIKVTIEDDIEEYSK